MHPREKEGPLQGQDAGPTSLVQHWIGKNKQTHLDGLAGRQEVGKCFLCNVL